jgi:small subunit ribosomal protein S18
MNSNNNRRGKPRTRKFCLFCAHKIEPDYKEPDLLRRLVSDRGKIFPRRMNGCCAVHQRRVASEVKRARHMALLSFVTENIR